MLITLLGIPILFATMYVSRWMGTIERARAKAFLDVDVPAPYRADPPPDKWWRQHVARFTDPATWVEVGYHVLMLPFGILTFTVVLTFWSLAIGWLSFPLWAWATDPVPSDVGFPFRWGTIGPAEYILAVPLGLLLLLLTPWIVRGLATANRMLVRGMIGSDVFARERTLTESRAAAVDLAAEDRRRIERDLHDGVQQRLVSLAMDLGRAKEKLDTDPERAKELVDEAHDEAKRAITEVRDLARGIHPAVLTDRGLDAALSALAARSPVPVDVSVRRRRTTAGLGRGRRLLRRLRGARQRREAREGVEGERDRASSGRRLAHDPGPGRRGRRRRRRRGVRPRRAPRPGRRARRRAPPALARRRADRAQVEIPCAS